MQIDGGGAARPIPAGAGGKAAGRGLGAPGGPSIPLPDPRAPAPRRPASFRRATPPRHDPWPPQEPDEVSATSASPRVPTRPCPRPRRPAARWALRLPQEAAGRGPPQTASRLEPGPGLRAAQPEPGGAWAALSCAKLRPRRRRRACEAGPRLSGIPLFPGLLCTSPRGYPHTRPLGAGFKEMPRPRAWSVGKGLYF